MVVVVSIAVFEPEEWIDALCVNALMFSEQSTLAVLHLNAAVHYKPELIARWNGSNPRLGVGHHRVPVWWGSGSVLYAHLLNAEHAVARWPDVQFFVMQVCVPRLLQTAPGTTRSGTKTTTDPTCARAFAAGE